MLPALHPGGAEMQVYYLLRYWPNLNEIVFFYYKDGLWSDKFLSIGVKLVKLNIEESELRYLGLFINYFKRAKILKKELKFYNSNVLYTWLFDASISGFLATIFTNINQISAVRFGANHYLIKPITLKKMVEYVLYIIIYHKSYKIIANSYAGMRTLINDMKIKKNNIRVIHNCFPIEKNLINPSLSTSFKNRNQIIIGFVGRLHKFKNPFFAIDAVSILGTHKSIKLQILGKEDGISIKELEAYAFQKKVNIECLGHIENIKSHLDKFNVFISTSSTVEGCSNVILEALSIGLPVVATDVGDNRLLLSNKRGKIISTHDTKSFANAIMYYICNEDKRQNERAQYIRDHFSINKMVDDTRSILVLT